ncbi:MAG: alpha/beta hydrolase [Phycisphaerae bacterium]
MRRMTAMVALTYGLTGALAVEAQQTRPRAGRNAAATRPAPDVQDARYGPHERNVLDLWKARSPEPAPLLVFIHGGGFRGGDKSQVPLNVLAACLREGISVASINYRLSHQAPFPAPMLDGARAIQFLRLQAREWNLDPRRIAASGGSAGAGISLWIGFHDDLADPKSDDPVLRQSSRLACMAVNGAQCTYDPRWIRENIGAAAAAHPALLPFYGITEEEAESQKAAKLYEQAAPITYLTRDDPPVWALYAEPDGPLPADAKPGAGIHHPKFGRYLKEKMDALGIECVVRHTDEFRSRRNARGGAEGEMVAFLVKHLKPRRTTQGR